MGTNSRARARARLHVAPFYDEPTKEAKSGKD